uniref:Odorant receptor 15.37 n=1 Tax=Scophthalmus maximus TaxID=52904 RepID=A0A8D2ZY62_SCOMX
MNKNVSPAVLLTLETLGLPDANIYPAFLFGTLTYLLIMFFNLLLLMAIAVSKNLHKPMFILLFNLPISDMLGATAFFPQFISSIVTQNRLISQPACVTQAFLIHFYGTGNLLILMFILTAMAYDRYIAICFPLKYNTVMTNAHIMRMITTVWLTCLVLIGVLFYLLLRLPRCRSEITHPYCDNPTLLSLVCANTAINNIYGLFIVAFSQVIANGVILYTYLQILVACFRSKQQDTRAKALQTCATHLIVFLLLECLGLFTIISYRIKNISPHLRRFMGLATLIFPPTLNPIIYGLKTKEIREKVVHFFTNKILPC